MHFLKEEELKELKAIRQQITQRYLGLIVSFLVSEREISEIKERIPATDFAIHKHCHISKPNLCLIRPD